MKTLIFNGSPRINGHTSALVAELSARLGGETTVVRAYDQGISPCIDCRWCWKNSGCAVKDAMQAVYDEIQLADAIVIASPVYFFELSGQLLAILSRLQTYWSARYLRGEAPVPKSKQGGIMLVRGGMGQAPRALETAKVLLDAMNAHTAGIVFAENSDSVPSLGQPDVLKSLKDLSEKLKRPL